jgi:hypothetical protein
MHWKRPGFVNLAASASAKGEDTIFGLFSETMLVAAMT